MKNKGHSIVAAYGTLKRNYGNHRVMEQAKGKFLGKDYVQVRALNGNGFPCVKFSDTSDKWLEVELYEVEDKNVPIIDSLEGYTEGSDYNNFYDRIEVKTLNDRNVFVYEIINEIQEDSNKLEDHFVKEVPSPRFYSWER